MTSSMGAEPCRNLGNLGVWLEALQWVSSQKHGLLIPLHAQLTHTKILLEVYYTTTTAPSCLQQLSGTGELHIHQILWIRQDQSKSLFWPTPDLCHTPTVSQSQSLAEFPLLGLC